ncbi:MAG: metallophosphoesterase [Fulvivirga sp.]|uniref:metallophosphoesterase n=1 Tax=Fulvivirga sp. TaxID=1931237 RepID=UPI0032EFA240
MRKFVIGDIHGANIALEQCLERSAFDFANDLLISIGDICDGWPETNQCFETLLKVQHFVLTMGNHDFWALEWALGNEVSPAWLANGGENTLKSYPDGMPESHFNLLSAAKSYYELDNKLFVHAGIDTSLSMENQDSSILLWDRNFFEKAIAESMKEHPTSLTSYKEVFIGHTPIHKLGHTKPIKCAEVWMMDTGAGWGEKLSIMDIETKEVFQSDRVENLYPKGAGRN